MDFTQHPYVTTVPGEYMKSNHQTTPTPEELAQQAMLKISNIFQLRTGAWMECAYRLGEMAIIDALQETYRLGEKDAKRS